MYHRHIGFIVTDLILQNDY